jgi:hypothetical protein
MRKFKSFGQAQRFLGVHAAVQNLFNFGRHLVRTEYYRDLRVSAFNEWETVTAGIVCGELPWFRKVCLSVPVSELERRQKN